MAPATMPQITVAQTLEVTSVATLAAGVAYERDTATRSDLAPTGGTHGQPPAPPRQVPQDDPDWHGTAHRSGSRAANRRRAIVARQRVGDDQESAREFVDAGHPGGMTRCQQYLKAVLAA